MTLLFLALMIQLLDKLIIIPILIMMKCHFLLARDLKSIVIMIAKKFITRSRFTKTH